MKVTAIGKTIFITLMLQFAEQPEHKTARRKSSGQS